MEYEICYLIGESKEADLDKIRPNIEKIIEKHKGTFLEGEFVRKRRLSYDIKGEKRGTYVARRFTVPSKDERDEQFPDYDIMGEINKELRFNQEILRYMVVKTDDLPPLKDLEIIDERSAAQARGREDRRTETRTTPLKVTPPKVQEVKAEEVKVVEKKEEVVAEPVKEVKEKKEEVAIEEAVKEEVIEAEAEEVKEVKPKKKTKKKEEKILDDDDIDGKLDEILNI